MEAECSASVGSGASELILLPLRSWANCREDFLQSLIFAASRRLRLERMNFPVPLVRERFRQGGAVEDEDATSVANRKLGEGRGGGGPKMLTCPSGEGRSNGWLGPAREGRLEEGPTRGPVVASKGPEEGPTRGPEGPALGGVPPRGRGGHGSSRDGLTPSGAAWLRASTRPRSSPRACG